MSATTRRKKAEAARAAEAVPARPRDRHRYWLVQRLRAPYAAPGRAGFDALFACDYMGSAEFEWGAVPKALQSVRSAKRLTVEAHEITWGGVTRTVWFVGPEQGMAEKIADWDDWCAEGCQGKERSRFTEAFGGHLEDWHGDPIAWWSLRDDIAWTLDAETAEKLLAGFTGKTAKR